MPPESVSQAGKWQRLSAVSAEGFASGAPNTGLGEVLPIWLANYGVPVELIGLLP